MSEQFEARLIECLDALENQEPIEPILARYPADAAELRRALAVVDALPALAIEPEVSAQDASRQAFLAQAAQLSQGKVRHASTGGFFLLRAGILLVGLITAGAIPVAASGSALPGDPLYGVKREVETVQLQLAPNQAARQAISDQHNQRRVQEIDDLVRDGRTAQTDFSGRLDAVQAGAVQVAGRKIVIPSGMQTPNLPVGTLVEVTVEVHGGDLTLVNITPLTGEETAQPSLTSVAVPDTPPVATPAPSITEESDGGGKQTQEAEPGGDGRQTETSDGGEGSGKVEATQSGEGSGGSTQESGGGQSESTQSGDKHGGGTPEPTSSDGGSGGGGDGGGSDGGSGGGSDGGK